MLWFKLIYVIFVLIVLFYHICFAFKIWIVKKNIKTYAEFIDLYLGGSFEQGIFKGFKKAVSKYFDIKSSKKLQRKIQKNLMLIASVKGDEFRFGGSTKGALDMPELQKETEDFVAQSFFEILNTNPDLIEFLRINLHLKR